LPGALIGSIVQVEGTGNSSYNALRASATKRFSHGLQFNASYTWSKSIDYNSLSSPPDVVTVQNSYDLRDDRGVSDFDARHRLVTSDLRVAIHGQPHQRGLAICCHSSVESGNPVNTITTNKEVFDLFNHASFGQPGKSGWQSKLREDQQQAIPNRRFRLFAADAIRFEVYVLGGTLRETCSDDQSN